MVSLVFFSPAAVKFNTIGISKDAPGAMASFGKSTVVQPHPGRMAAIEIEERLRLVRT